MTGIRSWTAEVTALGVVVRIEHVSMLPEGEGGDVCPRWLMTSVFGQGDCFCNTVTEFQLLERTSVLLWNDLQRNRRIWTRQAELLKLA